MLKIFAPKWLVIEAIVFAALMMALFNPLRSYFQWIEYKGISSENITFFLILISSTAIIAVYKHFIGYFSPNYSFILSSIIATFLLGLFPYMLITVLAYCIAYTVKYIIGNKRMHIASKLGLNWILLSVMGAIFMGALIYWQPAVLNKAEIVIAAIILMIFILEKNTSLIIKNASPPGLFSITGNILLMLFLSFIFGAEIAGYKMTFLADLLREYPDFIIIGSVLLNIGVGFYTGLRLEEVIRFRALLNKN
jgi:hypothetical protein